jgi:hypothetical protein
VNKENDKMELLDTSLVLGEACISGVRIERWRYRLGHARGGRLRGGLWDSTSSLLITVVATLLTELVGRAASVLKPCKKSGIQLHRSGQRCWWGVAAVVGAEVVVGNGGGGQGKGGGGEWRRRPGWRS